MESQRTFWKKHILIYIFVSCIGIKAGDTNNKEIKKEEPENKISITFPVKVELHETEEPNIVYYPGKIDEQQSMSLIFLQNMLEINLRNQILCNIFGSTFFQGAAAPSKPMKKKIKKGKKRIFKTPREDVNFNAELHKLITRSLKDQHFSYFSRLPLKYQMKRKDIVSEFPELNKHTSVRSFFSTFCQFARQDEEKTKILLNKMPKDEQYTRLLAKDIAVAINSTPLDKEEEGKLQSGHDLLNKVGCPQVLFLTAMNNYREDMEKKN